MKKLYCECETIEQANKTVKRLLDDDISAYRQGIKVFIDDGGIDDGYSENDFFTSEINNDQYTGG